jgi:hypothetical protein
VRGILGFITNWCGIFEKPVMIHNVDETGFTLKNKLLKILGGKGKADVLRIVRMQWFS